DGALEHFRLSQSAEELLKAKRSLISAMSRNAGTVIAQELDAQLLAELSESKTRNVRLFQKSFLNAIKQTSSMPAEPGEFEPPKPDLPPLTHGSREVLQWTVEQVLSCFAPE